MKPQAQPARRVTVSTSLARARNLGRTPVLFDVDVSDQDGWTLLRVTGELDVATAPRLRQEAVRVVSDGRLQLVMDLSGVDFLDSTGLGVIIGVLKRVRGHGGELVLAGLSAQVRKVFEITRVSEIVQIVESVSDATCGGQDG